MPKNDKSATRYKIRRKIPDPIYSLDEIVRPHVIKSPLRPRAKEQLAIAAVEAVAPTEAQPFLKWVGGKAQLLSQFDEFFPARIDRYVEPFIGGGAVFFHLKHRFPQMKAFLRDNNDELINTCKAVRDYPKELMRRLDKHLKEFLADRENYYYCVRAKHHLPKADVLERAARMIFLNKTCYNGLWRVNSRGEFNVPIGSSKILSFQDCKQTQIIMKPYKTEFYGYCCEWCGITAYLAEHPEDSILCPFCGDGVRVRCDSVRTVHVEKTEPYPVENWEITYTLRQ